MVKKVLTVISIVIFIILSIEVAYLKLKPISQQLTYDTVQKASASEK